ncbi:unnamed protein product [Gordionus sp. m RMFG-2023]
MIFSKLLKCYKDTIPIVALNKNFHNCIYFHSINKSKVIEDEIDFFGISDIKQIIDDLKIIKYEGNDINSPSLYKNTKTAEDIACDLHFENLPEKKVLFEELSSNKIISNKLSDPTTEKNVNKNIKFNTNISHPKELALSSIKRNNLECLSKPKKDVNIQKGADQNKLKSNILNLKHNVNYDQNNKSEKDHLGYNKSEINLAKSNSMPNKHHDNIDDIDISTNKSIVVRVSIGLQKLTERLDSKGFKIFDEQVQNWGKVPKYQVIDEIKRNILYQDGDRKNLYSIADLRESLAKSLNLTEQALYIVHRLDRETTGVLLLAKNQETQTKLNASFRKRLIQKTYRAIVVGVPEHSQGIIDIPLVEKEFSGKYKMFVAPIVDENGKILDRDRARASLDEKFARKYDNKDHNTHYLPAISDYKILQNNLGACLIEIKSKTGYKHQIRAHLAYGLSCPILGDHKYSHIHQNKPQKLSTLLLRKLGVRQQKVRTLPLHLHAFSILIPSGIIDSVDSFHDKNRDKRSDNGPESTFADGIEIFANNLPYHFAHNMRTLGLDH